MGFRVETVIGAPGTAQYAGEAVAEGRAGGARRPPPDAEQGIAAIVADVRRAEALGFDALSVPEGGHDPFLPLVLAAEHSERLTLGTNVAIAFPRSPLVTAQLAWDLARLSGGRFVLGLGTQSRAHVERRYAARWVDPAGPRLREYVLCLRAMFESFQQGGKPHAFEGQHYRFDLLPVFSNPGPIAHPHVPIHLGAVNPYAARLAGELGEGVRLHPIATFKYAREVIVPAIEEGAARAGRSRAAVKLVAAPFLATAPDEASLGTARDAARQQVAFYAATRGYRRVLAHHGWEALGEELGRLAAAGRWADMGARISDEMLDEWAVVATWDDLPRRITEKLAGVADGVVLDLPDDLARDDALVRAIVAALRGSAPPQMLRERPCQ